MLKGADPGPSGSLGTPAILPTNCSSHCGQENASVAWNQELKYL